MLTVSCFIYRSNTIGFSLCLGNLVNVKPLGKVVLRCVSLSEDILSTLVSVVRDERFAYEFLLPGVYSSSEMKLIRTWKGFDTGRLEQGMLSL